ncbi:MAG: MarR family transcriptional regulator [Pseudomonadota bacterium]
MDIAKQAKQTREASTGWYIQRLAGRLDAMMTDALKPHDMNLAQFPIMMTALEFDGLTQADYAKRFRMPAYAISRAVDALVDKGLLERRPDMKSRRAHNIHVTQAGRALAPALFDIIEQVNGKLLQALDGDEANHLRQSLGKILNAS